MSSKQQKMDYEDAYLTMKEKYMQLTRELRTKEDSWALERVKLRKASSSSSNQNKDKDHLNDSSAFADEQVPQKTVAPAARPTSASTSTKKKPSPKSTTSKRPASAALANRTNLARTPTTNSTFRGVTFEGAAAKPPAATPQRPTTKSAASSPIAMNNTKTTPSSAKQQSPLTAARTPTSGRANNNTNNQNDISYTSVQLGALSQQLSPQSGNTSGQNQQQNQHSPRSNSNDGNRIPLPATATTIPPVHFEVVSLNQQPGGGGGNTTNQQHQHHFSPSSLLDHPGAKRPPENSMFWGADNELPLDQTVTGRTVAEINDKLRAQLQDCEVQLRRFNQESILNRQVMDRQEAQVQQLEHQLLLIAQERDSMAQRTSATTTSVSNLQSQLEAQLQQHETVRNSLEVQCRELRNKLINEIDQKEYLEKEVNKAKNELQEQLLTVSSLQSRVSVSEANLSNQRNANETLLVEMRSLNEQLATERRKTLAATRDVHLASHSRQRTEELELQLTAIKEEMKNTQNENLALLEKVARCQEDALKTASQAVEAELTESKSQASHWEHVALLQFRELEQNSKHRSELRQELETTKAERDQAIVQMTKLKSENTYANAKLDLCWPSHSRDTAGLNEEQVRASFSKRFGRTYVPGASPGSSNSFVGSGGDNNNISNTTMNHSHNDSLLRGAPVKEEDLISELQAANAVLMAENESLRLQNSLLIERLEEAGVHFKEKTKELETKVEKVVRHEQANVAHASRQADHISFLEAQVRNLRGSTVHSQFPIEELGVNETVFEVFVGQLLLENPPAIQSATSGARGVPNVVAVVDFLIHESTVTNPVLESLHAAFDQTFAYRVNADAVLLHNIANGTINVEIHEVRGTTHRAIARGEIGFRDLLKASHEKRPMHRTHVTLKKLVNNNSNNNNSNHQNESALSASSSASSEVYGRIEIIITSRVPFPPLFVQLCDEFLESASAASGDENLVPNNNNQHKQKQTLLHSHQSATAVTGSTTSPGRTLFMPDPRDSSLTLSTSANQNQNQNQQQQMMMHSSNLSSSSLAAADPIVILMKCNQIKMKFLRVAVEFSEKEAPLLSWWYSFSSSIGDSWVLPCVTEGKYDAPIEVTNTHDFTTSEELVACLRRTIPVVAFDEAEEDPAKYWGVASMTLSVLMTAPTQTLSLQLPVLSPNGHTRATLFAEASIASVVH